MKVLFTSLAFVAGFVPAISSGADDFFVRCPKSAKHQTDRASVQTIRKFTYEPQSLYVFVGKDIALAEKVQSLLPQECGQVELSMAGIKCLDCKNPYSEMYDKYKAGNLSDADILKKMVEVNTGEEKAFLVELSQPGSPAPPARAASGATKP